MLEAAYTGNHPSFVHSGGLEDPSSGLHTVAQYVNKGFGMLFKDRAAAEAYLQSPVAPAPLGAIVKDKPDGSRKTRVIMDLKWNLVNEAVSLSERQVLPTVFAHAADLADLGDHAAEREEIHTLILDFSDAFMGVPLAASEMPFSV